MRTAVLKSSTEHIYATILFIALLWCSTPLIASAQLLQGEGSLIRIESNPLYPEPHTGVVLSLNDYSVNTLGAEIVWFVNNKRRAESTNARSITIGSGALGEKTDISVQILKGGVLSYVANHTLNPIDINIILESDTYVPSFYKGRALPSAEATVRAIALVHDGTGISLHTYSYKWTFNETVISGGAQKGMFSTHITVPRLRGGLLTVEVYGTENKIIGKKTIGIGSVDPSVLFYEYSPLRGLAKRAMQTPFSLPRGETTVYAEPYFLNVQSIDSSAVDFVWKLNNTNIRSGDLPNSVVLGTTETRGDTNLGVTATTKQRRPQLLSEKIRLIFE